MLPLCRKGGKKFSVLTRITSKEKTLIKLFIETQFGSSRNEI